jgi:hypothetical protein
MARMKALKGADYSTPNHPTKVMKQRVEKIHYLIVLM